MNGYRLLDQDRFGAAVKTAARAHWKMENQNQLYGMYGYCGMRALTG